MRDLAYGPRPKELGLHRLINLGKVWVNLGGRVMRITTILIFYLFAFPCHAELNNNFKLSSTNSVVVELVDDATDGCWTNLREVREYAEEKLRSKGANIVKERMYGPNDYAFQVSVIAYRVRSGCVASITLDLSDVAMKENTSGHGVVHFGSIGSRAFLISGFYKTNNEVLNYVKGYIEEANR